MARNTAHGAKVPFYKTWWFWVIIILFLYGFFSGITGDDDEDGSQEETTVSESAQIKDFQGEPDPEDPFEAEIIKSISEIL